MEINFRTRKLAKCFADSKQAVKAFGKDVARKYIQRVNLIKASNSLEEIERLPGLRCHELKGKRRGQYAVNLTGFYRLIFSLEGHTLNVVMIEEVSKHYDD